MLEFFIGATFAIGFVASYCGVIYPKIDLEIEKILHYFGIFMLIACILLTVWYNYDNSNLLIK